MTGRLERICLEHGMRMSGQRRAILDILDKANDHPCAEEVHQRVVHVEPTISLATVYRTLNILAQIGILSRVELGDGKAHYEEAGEGHHEHLIDVETGKVVEFCDPTIEALLREAAGRLGYRLLQYRLEVFGEAAGAPRANLRPASPLARSWPSVGPVLPANSKPPFCFPLVSSTAHLK
ncbi:MAG TPA: Fur family transcriptional regulator [Stellaceae bacterium]|nr:Fur family transcriptional regulator [Stellaceae bacterium]